MTRGSIQEYTAPASATNDFVYWHISSMVRGWWDGSIPNYGVMLKATDEISWESWKSFCSSDWGSASHCPALIVTYFDPTP